MDAAARKLRFAIMCETETVPAWAVDCVERLVASGYAELVLRIQETRSRAAKPRAPGALLHRLYAEHWLGRRSSALQRRDLRTELPGVEVLVCSVEEPSSCLHAKDVRALRERGLDFILRLGAQPIAGDVLGVPRFGVWSYRHDREGVPCFWEVLESAPRTNTSLERVTQRVEDAVELCRGSFGTCKASWVNNVDRALGGSSDFCVRVCAEIAAGGGEGLVGRPAVPSNGSGDRAPTNPDMLRFLLQTGTQSVRKVWELMFHMEVWNVGFTRQSVAQILESARVDPAGVTWCKPHASGHFIADPFAYQKDGVEHVLVEDYPQGGRGRICELVQPGTEKHVELAADLEEPHHLSYPFIFVENGETYCVPEAYQSGRVDLYRRVNGAWRLEHNLIQGQPIVDPTLFKHEGLYWILCTLQNDGAWGNLKLHAYYSERLDSGWKPHPLNPVKCDIGSSRPAGAPLVKDGKLYRPSQDCSETYGGAVVINHVAKLSPTEFEEIEVARIEPLAQGPYPDGLHTVNPMAQGAVIDSKRFSFDPLAWRKNWGRRHEVFR